MINVWMKASQQLNLIKYPQDCRLRSVIFTRYFDSSLLKILEIQIQIIQNGGLLIIHTFKIYSKMMSQLKESSKLKICMGILAVVTIGVSSLWIMKYLRKDKSKNPQKQSQQVVSFKMIQQTSNLTLKIDILSQSIDQLNRDYTKTIAEYFSSKKELIELKNSTMLLVLEIKALTGQIGKLSQERLYFEQNNQKLMRDNLKIAEKAVQLESRLADRSSKYEKQALSLFEQNSRLRHQIDELNSGAKRTSEEGDLKMNEIKKLSLKVSSLEQENQTIKNVYTLDISKMKQENQNMMQRIDQQRSQISGFTNETNKIEEINVVKDESIIRKQLGRHIVQHHQAKEKDTYTNYPETKKQSQPQSLAEKQEQLTMQKSWSDNEMTP